MKVLVSDNETACWQCDCGRDFWTDACTEENLFWDGKELIPECPDCRRLREGENHEHSEY